MSTTWEYNICSVFCKRKALNFIVGTMHVEAWKIRSVLHLMAFNAEKTLKNGTLYKEIILPIRSFHLGPFLYGWHYLYGILCIRMKLHMQETLQNVGTRHIGLWDILHIEVNCMTEHINKTCTVVLRICCEKSLMVKHRISIIDKDDLTFLNYTLQQDK